MGDTVLTFPQSTEGTRSLTIETGKAAAEERILPRHQFEARIKIEIVREHKTVSSEGWARDLSESGLGAFVGATLGVGELVSLRIPLSNQFELVVPAIVMRNVGTQYGFQFTALSGKQRDELRRALSRCKVVPHPDADVPGSSGA